MLPSEWFETFGLVAVEAFAFGTPVAASNLGQLPDIVREGESGLLSAPADADALHKVLAETLTDAGLLQRLSVGARRAFDTLYNERVNYEILMQIYHQAIANYEANQ